MTLLVNSVDQQTWDRFVSTSTNGHFMQSYAWGLFQQRFGWHVDRVARMVDGEIVAAASLLSRGVPVIGPKIFYAPRGPVVDWSDLADVQSFVDDLRAFAAVNGGVGVRCDPYLRESEFDFDPSKVTGWIDTQQKWSFWNAPRFVLWLDLADSEDALLKAMERTCQRDIRAGYKRNVEFTLGGRGDIPEFYRMLASMSTNKGIAAHDEAYYAALYDSLGTSCQVGLFFANFESRAISTGMSIAYGDKSWLMYAASDKEFFKLRVNRNVQWEMLKWAKNLGCTRYDFRGTATGDPPSPSDPGFGVYEFKRSFGPSFTRLVGYFDIARPTPLYRLARVIEERGIPLAYKAKVKLAALAERKPKDDREGKKVAPTAPESAPVTDDPPNSPA